MSAIEVNVQKCLPHGPAISPALQLAQFLRDPLSFLDACERECGDYFTIHLLGQPPLVCTSDPEALRWVFTRTEDELSHANHIMRLVLGDRSVLFMDGAEHRRERRMLKPMFHGRRMRAYGEVMERAARERIAAWPRGRPFAVHERLQALTLEIMATCVFGGAPSGQQERLRELLRAWLDESLSPVLCAIACFSPDERLHDRIMAQADTRGGGLLQKVKEKVIPWQALANRRAAIDEILFDEIARCKRERDAGRDDLLSMLCDTRDEHGAPMSDGEIRDELLTILVGGHESTAVSLSWVLYHVMRNRGVGRRMREEARRTFGQGPVAPDRLGELSYIDAVINESMRLTPIALGVPRKLNRASRVGRYELPEGTILLTGIHLAHRRPELWERPADFSPERFLLRSPEPFTFFPFGGGPRRCVGAEFARQEMRIILAELFSRASIAEEPELSVRPQLRGVHFSPPPDMSIELCDVQRDTPVSACA